MNTTCGCGAVPWRVAARCLCCSIVTATLCLYFASALHLRPVNPKEDGEPCQSLEPLAGREETVQPSFLKDKRERLSDGEITQHRSLRTLEAQPVRKRRALGSLLTPSAERNASEEHIQARPSRSPHHSSEDHLRCLVKSSCSSRDAQTASDVADMFPCMCDDECYLYGDCCHDHDSVSLPPPALRPVCRPLTPVVGRHYALHRTVFLVNQCPAGTERQLAERCLGEAPHNYKMDIPVFSKTSGIGYSNILCAACHNDTNIYNFEMSVSCVQTVNSTTELENMTYHSGELRWTSPNDTLEDTDLSCLLDVAYPPSIGRWCQSHLVDTCREDWPIEEHVRRCAAYNYYVQTERYVYKNRDCALCNGVSEDEIECLSLFKLSSRRQFPTPPSIMELFDVKRDCKDDEVWDALYRRCEHVSCGFLFTLVDGKCERSNKTEPKDGQSYLNVSCYVAEHRQNLSTIFPNQSIYLNETHRLYHFGEYEFNGSWVRVCDDKERWTPFMHILSSVLILVSLICLLLHMAIFIALPKRRNIPSMNLVSMTISLFMAEFMFLTFFQLKINHVSCIITGVLMYYFLCVSFLWMNVMSIDIFRTFYSRTYRTKSRRVFTQYSLYAWLSPIGGVIVALAVDQLWPELIIAPHFGTNTCWLNNKWGLVTFFTLPSGMVILANLILYMVSVRNIYTQIKSGEIASSTIRRNDGSSKYSGPQPKQQNSMKPSSTGRKGSTAPSERNSNGIDSSSCKERIRDKLNRGFQKKHRKRLILYCKLALIMGLTWIFAFISIHTKSIVFEYLFIVFNGLQGTFIFASFDLKRKVWEELWHKAGCRGKQHHTNFGAQDNKLSNLTPTSVGCCKHRWSSSQGHSATTNVSKAQPSQETAESEV